MPLVVNFSLHEKLLISANHFALVVFFFGATEEKDNEDKVIGRNKNDNPFFQAPSLISFE
jgi:hypothetical protein